MAGGLITVNNGQRGLTSFASGALRDGLHALDVGTPLGFRLRNWNGI